MNRAQRRKAANKPGRTGTPMTSKVEFKIDYGHTDTHVLVQYSMSVPNILLTPQQTDDMIAALQNAKQRLAEHIERKAHG